MTAKLLRLNTCHACDRSEKTPGFLDRGIVYHGMTSSALADRGIRATGNAEHVLHNRVSGTRLLAGMALRPLAIGDILMLSQTAWKIGRAFTEGAKSAPSEFAEGERESNSLSEALKLVAEALHEDGSILSKAEDGTRYAVNTILESVRNTLEDLESFVDRYQSIKKKDTGHGFVVECSWSLVVLENYRLFKWTTEGGDIQALRNMLQMHVDCIDLTMQTLQSRSLARLDRTVVPMAQNVVSIHDKLSGDLGQKIDDVHRILMEIVNSTPSRQSRER